MIERIEGEKDYSPYIIWEIIEKCNFNCGYCTFVKNPNFNCISNIKRGIDTITSSTEYPIIDFTGGEPTLHPDLSEILDYSTEKSKNDVYVTTNASMNVNELNRVLDNVKHKQKLGFYLTYHHKQTNISQYIEFANMLKDNNCKVFIKFLCDPKDFNGIKKSYEYIKNIPYDRFFMKYRWNHRKEGVYTNEYYEWIIQNSKSNDIYFNVSFNNEKTKKYYYDSLVYEGLNNFQGMYCKCLYLLYINILGRIYPSCLKEMMSSSIGNLYTLPNLNYIYNDKDRKIRCIKDECTEVINNPDKWRNK